MNNMLSPCIIILIVGIATSVHFGEDPTNLVHLLVMLLTIKLTFNILDLTLGFKIEDDPNIEFFKQRKFWFVVYIVFILVAVGLDWWFTVKALLSGQRVSQVTAVLCKLRMFYVGQIRKLNKIHG